MPALVSPGLSITVTDESQYLPTAVGTIPFVLLATSENKVINGTIAPGTAKSNAGKVYGISSQRDLSATFGSATFRLDASGTPIHADELNEYGVMAAYSALGLGSRVWAIRADINLDDLVGTTVRPVGEVPDGTNWFDTADTTWGIYQYDQVTDTFTNKVPLIISNVNDVTVQSQVPIPNASLGKVGSYAVVVRDANNYVFYKNAMNVWVQVGSADWQASLPTVQGINSEPDFTGGGTCIINGITVDIPSAATVDTIVSIINGEEIDGITANNVNGFLTISATILSASNGTDPDGAISLVDGVNTPLGTLGIMSGQYYSPTLYYGNFNQNPAWSTYDAIPRPTGSIWTKTSVSGNGADFAIKQYNSTLQDWTTLATPVYSDGYTALYGLDSLGGGSGIQAGSMFVKYDTNNVGKLSFKVYTLSMGGHTSVTGEVPAGPIDSGSTFTILASQPGSDMYSSNDITIVGVNAAAFVSAILTADIPNVTARLTSSGAITLTHETGGIITLVNTSIGTNPITIAGFTSSTAGVVPNIVPGTINLTNWRLAAYTYSATEPYTAPDDGKHWYYSDPTSIDIMISDTGGWKGYKNVARDARGFNLQNTDPRGVIVSASEPKTQSDNTDLVPGDLWVDSGDLENYPRLYRRTATSTWQLIDNTDRISQNGIVFADMRWDLDGTTDPITGHYPAVAAMQYSDYIDLDAQDYRLYPRGTLVFNTRRSGYNIKRFVNNYFTARAFPNDVLPDVRATWVTDSGNKEDGTPYAGHHAQRALVVKAMKAALDGSLDIRDEAYNFNLLVCPGYPELIVNLIGLNNDRGNTGFIIGDVSPTLPATINAITEYNNHVAVNHDPYVALYYPGGLTNDLSGNEIAVPASHIMLRTYIRNDNVAYPWFAPAGTRRGLVDNANAIGYVDANSGMFVKAGINQQLRDAMYELNLNPITLLHGAGLVVYGQKTRNPVPSSLDRVNVARLVNYLRTVLRPVGDQFLFEPNDKITRDQIKQVIESVLNDLIAKRGVYDYLVVCDSSNNTSDRISRNELYVDIAIEPMKAVEFIYIPIRLKNPGAIKGNAGA